MIKAEMVYNLDDMKELAKKGLFISNLRIPVIIITIASAFLTVFLLFTYTEYKDYIFYTLAAAIAGIFLYTRWYVDMPEKNLRRMRAAHGDIPLVFEFDDEVLTVSFSSADICEIFKYKYKIFSSCLETDKHFFLSFSSGYSIYILRKNTLTEGSPDELRRLLQEKFGNRYKSKIKKDRDRSK